MYLVAGLSKAGYGNWREGSLLCKWIWIGGWEHGVHQKFSPIFSMLALVHIGVSTRIFNPGRANYLIDITKLCVGTVKTNNAFGHPAPEA